MLAGSEQCQEELGHLRIAPELIVDQVDRGLDQPDGRRPNALDVCIFSHSNKDLEQCRWVPNEDVRRVHLNIIVCDPEVLIDRADSNTFVRTQDRFVEVLLQQLGYHPDLHRREVVLLHELFNGKLVVVFETQKTRQLFLVLEQ